MGKNHHLIYGISCAKMSTAVATIKVHSDRFEIDFDLVVTYLSQYVLETHNEC